jgi:hypothetical protein
LASRELQGPPRHGGQAFGHVAELPLTSNSSPALGRGEPILINCGRMRVKAGRDAAIIYNLKRIILTTKP